MLISSFTESGLAYAPLQVTETSPAGYTDAIMRDSFKQTVVHSPVAVTIQVSLIHTPDEESDADWVNLAENTKFFAFEHPVRWLRLKGLPEGETAYILSIEPKYE